MGFEPMVSQNTLVFKTSALNHSATYPKGRNYISRLCYVPNKHIRPYNIIMYLIIFVYTLLYDIFTKSLYCKLFGIFTISNI